MCVNADFAGSHHKMMVHRIVLALNGVFPEQGMVIDHIDGNPFNNRFENLRVCTHGQNISNNSGYRHYRGKARDLPKGVTREPRTTKFRAQITENGIKIYLGCFDTPEQAHEAWKARAKEVHGEFFRAS